MKSLPSQSGGVDWTKVRQYATAAVLIILVPLGLVLCTRTWATKDKVDDLGQYAVVASKSQEKLITQLKGEVAEQKDMVAELQQTLSAKNDTLRWRTDSINRVGFENEVLRQRDRQNRRQMNRMEGLFTDFSQFTTHQLDSLEDRIETMGHMLTDSAFTQRLQQTTLDRYRGTYQYQDKVGNIYQIHFVKGLKRDSAVVQTVKRVDPLQLEARVVRQYKPGWIPRIKTEFIETKAVHSDSTTTTRVQKARIPLTYEKVKTKKLERVGRKQNKVRKSKQAKLHGATGSDQN